jgi:chemotaxis protein CheZ
VEQDNQDTKTSYERDQVVNIINSVIDKVGHSSDPATDIMCMELMSLKTTIDELHKDLGSINPGAINDEHIKTATDELDAIVEATAEATGGILGACEAMGYLADKIGGEDGDALTAEVTKIYEACTFQDITGQRVSKVVGSLKTIEEKVLRLVMLIGGDIDSGQEEEARSGDDALLNGPQMEDKAISQDDIDKLLADFD